MAERERIMGLDYGSKTVGVAVSDEMGIIDKKDTRKCRETYP